jgi:hypothetical protein
MLAALTIISVEFLIKYLILILTSGGISLKFVFILKYSSANLGTILTLF